MVAAGNRIDQNEARMPKPKKSEAKHNNSVSLGFESKLWAAADALRNNMDAAEYKHVVLGRGPSCEARS
jgi:hypothetical protein